MLYKNTTNIEQNNSKLLETVACKDISVTQIFIVSTYVEMS
jgi:hypothetical protein